jgi:MOSC domain-containing protein YiiM
MSVTRLFIKTDHSAPMSDVGHIIFSGDGIGGNVACAPFRQVLLTSHSVTAACGLKDSDLRENVVLDFDALYDLPSGSIVRIGDALVRLTFHCEPCKKIAHLVDLKSILHRRGVFGTFLNSGRINVGDGFAVTEHKLEAIPYAMGERIRWFLKRHGAAAALGDLAHAIGLPASSGGKALAGLVRKFATG